MGNHQAASGSPAPRESHPSEDLSELPPLVAADCSKTVSPLDFMAGQEYHCPRCRSWPYREPPGTDSLLMSALPGNLYHRPFYFFRWCLVSCLKGRRAAAHKALAFAKAAGMCLMNGYAVFKVLGRFYNSSHFYKGKKTQAAHPKNKIFFTKLPGWLPPPR